MVEYMKLFEAMFNKPNV